MKFIVLEGLDGSGTTTQAARLCRWLDQRGDTVLPTHEPTDGPVGRIIRSTLRGEPGAPDVTTLPWLFAADRADHLARDVEPALAAGTWVVSDRYYHSSLAYQSLTLPLDEVARLNARFRAPDLTVFLDLPVDVCLERIAERGGVREYYEQRDRMERVAASYARVLAMCAGRGERVVVLDGNRPIDVVEAAVRAEVAKL